MRICGRKLWGGRPMSKKTKRKIIQGVIDWTIYTLTFGGAFALIIFLMGCA